MAKIKYNNIDNVGVDKTLKELRQWREERRSKQKDYSYKVPNHTPELSYLRGNRLDTTITWIGHSTFLCNMRDLISLPIQSGPAVSASRSGSASRAFR